MSQRVLILAVVSFALFHCKLDSITGGNGDKAHIFPKDGSTQVPLNVVVEVQFPKEMGVSVDQMTPELFSISQCTDTSWSFMEEAFKPPQQQAADPASPDPKGEEEKNDTKTTVKPAESPVEFILQTKEEGTVFNYLVIKPAGRSSPLMPGTTYCVRTRQLTGKNGVTIEATETSFTTEDSANFVFQSKLDDADIEFPSQQIALTETNSNIKKDQILLYVRKPVRPEDVKGQITLCEHQPGVESTISCDGFDGEPVMADVSLIERLKTDEDDHIRAGYNVYAISPRNPPRVDSKYKLFFNLDNGNEEETSIGTITSRDISVAETSDLFWPYTYKETLNASGRNMYSKTAGMFYIGVARDNITDQGNRRRKKEPTRPETPEPPAQEDDADDEAQDESEEESDATAEIDPSTQDGDER